MEKIPTFGVNLNLSCVKSEQPDIIHQFSDFYNISLEQFFRFAQSVDCVIFGYHQHRLQVLLIDRNAEPFKGQAALPGDLVYPNEDIQNAALRVLSELTGISNIPLIQTGTYGKVDRHPVGRVITTAYFALVNSDTYRPKAQSWAGDAYWQDIQDAKNLAFDHADILNDALSMLRDRIRRERFVFDLLPSRFTLGEMQAMYESILNETYDKANFRKRILATGFLSDTGKYATNVPHRPPRLYEFNADKFNELKAKGFSFSI